MKKILIVALFLLFLPVFSASVKAVPIISDLNITPSEAWLGETVSISLKCYDDQGADIKVYGIISGPNITFQKNLIYSYGSYSVTIDNSYIDRSGLFNAALYCENNNSNVNTTNGSFFVSELTSYINSITPNPSYVGDPMEIDVVVKKDGIPLLFDVNFQVLLNGQLKTLKQDPPVYDTNKGWVLKIDAPTNEGNYDVEVIASYGRAETRAISNIEVKQPLQFDLVNIDKSGVRSDDNITMTFRALLKGKPIYLKSEYLNIQINSISLPIQNIVQSGEYAYVKVSAPQLSPGSYDLNIRFTYMGYVKDISKTIEYVVSINGKFLDSGGKPVFVQFRFIRNGTERIITTDSLGNYSGYIPIGLYDIQIIFPGSTLYLSSAVVNSFENPIRFDHPETSVNIPGIRNAGVFVFEVALSYQNAHIEMQYDDSRVTDESRISVYKCKNWNFWNKVCNGDWMEINTEIDTVKNLVKLNTSSFSAYVIGYRKSIKINFALDRDTYNLKDTIRIRGFAQDEDKNPIGEVEIKAEIQSTQISESIFSDASGIFSFDLLSPNQEGNYSILLTAERPPYFGWNQSTTIRVVRSKEINFIVPDIIRVRQGENFTAEASIANSGQTDLYNLTISLENLPREYYDIPKTISQLRSGEERKIQISFIIPEDASKTTYTPTIKISSTDIAAEYMFTLTIMAVSANNNQTVSTPLFTFPMFALPTAKIVLPAFSSEIICISLFAIASFSFAYIMKRRKNKNIERPDIKNLLLDIRREVNRELNEKER